MHCGRNWEAPLADCGANQSASGLRVFTLCDFWVVWLFPLVVLHHSVEYLQALSSGTATSVSAGLGEAHSCRSDLSGGDVMGAQWKGGSVESWVLGLHVCPRTPKQQGTGSTVLPIFQTGSLWGARRKERCAPEQAL